MGGILKILSFHPLPQQGRVPLALGAPSPIHPSLDAAAPSLLCPTEPGHCQQSSHSNNSSALSNPSQNSLEKWRLVFSFSFK